MVRHIVLVRFRKDVTADTKNSIFNQLSQLKTQIDGILGFQSGPNNSPETELTRGYNDLFWVDFETHDARNKYLSHPAHEIAGKRLVDNSEGGLEGLVVADLTI